MQNLPRLTVDALLTSLRTAFCSFGFVNATLPNINPKASYHTGVRAIVCLTDSTSMQNALATRILVSGQEVSVTNQHPFQLTFAFAAVHI